MFEKCELYSYEGLYLNEEEINKLNINKTDSIGLTSLLQNASCVFEMKDNKYLPADREKIQLNILSNINQEKEFTYILKNNILIILPIEILYGIKKDENIIAFWHNKNFRDVRFTNVKEYGVYAIIHEVDSTKSAIEEYEKQLKLRKIYNSLNINN